jgi:drug/metabolite transporter (DMT)-like permease
MYIPYRKAYISGMNPLSFITIFTLGELGATLILGAVFHGGFANLFGELAMARPALFWLFLGGLCWVIGDLFQQYAAKYIGIGRGIPLANTNQLWGLAWGALVFGELFTLSPFAKGMVIAGSLVMIAGAVAIGMANAPAAELENWKQAMNRECDRYGMDPQRVAAVMQGDDPLAEYALVRRWWDALVVIAALGIFVWLGVNAQLPSLIVNTPWMIVLLLAALVFLGAGGVLLWRRTRFS